MSEYDKFLHNVKENLAKKRMSKKKREAIYDAIVEKYRNSELFIPVAQVIEDTESITVLLHTRSNCFGSEGFAGIDAIPRDERVQALRDCYESCSPFPQQVTIDPVDEHGPFGRTKLHEAVLASDRRTVSKLIHKGADVSKKDNNGHTPFMLAQFNEQDNMVMFLEDLGIDE